MKLNHEYETKHSNQVSMTESHHHPIFSPHICRYQHKCDELEVQQKDFSSQYFTVEKEKKDIVLYLKRSLAQKEDELTDLLERLVGLQQAKDAEKDSFELQLSQLRQEFQENKDKLTSENMVLGKILRTSTP